MTNTFIAIILILLSISSIFTTLSIRDLQKRVAGLDAAVWLLERGLTANPPQN